MSADLIMRAYTIPDEKSEKMMAAYMACKAAGVEPPTDVEKYFDWEEPSPHGIPMNSSQLKDLEGTTKINTEGFEGMAINIDELPENIKTIVIGISY